ncbi:sce7726 family protein [Chitinophagaceae bacterium 26-R-25]|nr:sce7726 family protein [Chitinophagaceae bacterium 26-R-25]
MVSKHMIDVTHTEANAKAIKYIAKRYTPLSYKKDIIQLLHQIYPNWNFNEYEKMRLHELISNFLMENHFGEQALKFELFNIFKKKDLVAAFEIRVGNSRADFLTINGSTSSFEIKSSLDNLNKLKKQASDYILAFEFNHLVIDEKHTQKAIGLVPESFGLWSFKNGRKTIHRHASTNKNIDPEIQLTLLNKKDLKRFFYEVDGNVTQVLKQYSSMVINERFKAALKMKYSLRWNFLLNNVDLILPVDLQFFFKTNVNPNLIYQGI